MSIWPGGRADLSQRYSKITCWILLGCFKARIFSCSSSSRTCPLTTFVHTHRVFRAFQNRNLLNFHSSPKLAQVQLFWSLSICAADSGEPDAALKLADEQLRSRHILLCRLCCRAELNSLLFQGRKPASCFAYKPGRSYGDRRKERTKLALNHLA